jgi:hypothetical protein
LRRRNGVRRLAIDLPTCADENQVRLVERSRVGGDAGPGATPGPAKPRVTLARDGAAVSAGVERLVAPQRLHRELVAEIGVKDA